MSRRARITGGVLAASVAVTPLMAVATAGTADAKVVPVAQVVKKAKKKSWAQRQKTAQRAIKAAKAKRGKPYRWGATGPNAFDCSGLMVWSYRKAGVALPRTTYSQWSGIKNRISWKKLAPGDLVFRSGRGHVGMVVTTAGAGIKVIHAPHTGDVVRITTWSKSSFNGAVRPY